MKNLLLIIGTILLSLNGYSQVGINTTLPNAQLDIKSSNQVTPANTDGILIPRIDAFPVTNPNAAQQGMLVYLTTLSGGKPPGFYYWDTSGTPQWKGVGGNSSWNVLGNSGTSATTNFIGTTDDNDLVFKRFNIISGKLQTTNTSFGVNSLQANTSGLNNVSFGALSMFTNTSGKSNTASGYQSLYTNNSGDFNVANGFVALYKNISGNLNTANGSASMYNNTTGYENTAVGAGSLYTNSMGYQNVAAGLDALYFNTNGYNNSAIGNKTLFNNTTGNFNTAVGTNALYINKTANDNTAIGFESLRNNSYAEKNVAIGKQALFTQSFTNSNTNYNANNTAVGYAAMYNSNSTSSANGTFNTSLGSYSLSNNTTGSSNVAIGASALGATWTATGTMTGNRNVAVGAAAIKSLTTGNDNLAVGNLSLNYNTTGNNNVSIGADALFHSSAQSNGTVIGTGAMQNYAIFLPAGINDNVAIGYETLKGTNASSLYNQNTAVGYQSITSNSTGNNNTTLGFKTLFTNTSGSSNTALGNSSLYSNSTGSGNVAIGNLAGYNETGSDKLYIENSNSANPLIYGDFAADLVRFNGNVEIDNLTTVNNKMQVVNKNNFVHGIGNQIFGNGGDDFIISSREGVTETAGVYGDGNAVSIWSAGDANQGQVAALVYFLDEDSFDSSNTNPYDASAVIPFAVALKSYISPVGAYVQISDKNKKENIVKIENATEKINQISGYTYQFKLAPEEIKKGDKPIQSSGVLAQEVEKILPQAVQKNQNGDYFVDYAAITPLLIEAIKDQNTKIKALETANSEILKRLEKLENK